jgi:putative transposase
MQMERRGHTPEQVVRKLQEADRLLGEGTELPEVIKHLEVSEATCHRWREVENARLKRIVAEQVLENGALKEIARGNW